MFISFFCIQLHDTVQLLFWYNSVKNGTETHTKRIVCLHIFILFHNKERATMRRTITIITRKMMANVYFSQWNFFMLRKNEKANQNQGDFHRKKNVCVSLLAIFISFCCSKCGFKYIKKNTLKVLMLKKKIN